MWCFYDSGWVFLIVIQKAEKQKCGGKVITKSILLQVLLNKYLTKHVPRSYVSLQGVLLVNQWPESAFFLISNLFFGLYHPGSFPGALCLFTFLSCHYVVRRSVDCISIEGPCTQASQHCMTHVRSAFWLSKPISKRMHPLVNLPSAPMSEGEHLVRRSIVVTGWHPFFAC